MRGKQQIQQEVDKTLNSLEGIQRATANPYLFTRIKASLQKEEKSYWTKAFIFISKPAVAVTAVVIAIFINAAVFFESGTKTNQTSQESEQLFASEYNLSSDSIYDATIDQQ